MNYAKYISFTVLEDTCGSGVEFPEGDTEFDDCQNLACVVSYGCLVSKFRMPDKILPTYSHWQVFLAVRSSRSDHTASELRDHNPRDLLLA